MTATLSATLAILATLPHGLTPRLGSRAWRDRDRAARVLAGFGPLAIPALEAGARHPCPEVRERCGRLLYPYCEALAYRDAGRLFGELPPLWDLWYWNRLGGWSYDELCRQFVSKAGGCSRKACRLWVASQLLRRRPHAEIRRTLKEMKSWRGSE